MTNCLNDKFQKLFDYVKKHNYEGIDLFDGLNSKLKNTFLYKSRFFRLALIQFCKLSPINFRKILLVPEGFNPKGGALFLLGNLNMFNSTGDEQYKIEAQKLYLRLKETLIKREKGIAWGYNFDWQARAFYVPIGTPNVVTSVYAGKALLEYYKTESRVGSLTHQQESAEEALGLVKQIAEFILNEMIIFEDENSLCFGYIPGEDTQVHNANLLAASFLSSIEKYINSEEIKNKVEKSLNFLISDINEDGSWAYGTKPFHRWIDNFHTAFNIECLLNIQENLNLDINILQKVVDYYFDNLFTKEGLPKYYNNSLYPIDIHVIAEVIIVLDKIKNSKINYNEIRLKCIEQQILKLIDSFQDKKGYFYFQKNRFFFNKIPYIRWGQAWMFYALSRGLK
ncbi:MAG: hypothetical protein PHC64_07040 [Candidatus Gastranaerophilales bacterium]|nr:hypothetical protein [Candidatus Gastranaerophilales bacterium]